MIEILSPDEWRQRYIARLVVNYDYSQLRAEELANTMMSMRELGEAVPGLGPEEAADDTVSFWGPK